MNTFITKQKRTIDNQQIQQTEQNNTIQNRTVWVAGVSSIVPTGGSDPTSSSSFRTCPFASGSWIPSLKDMDTDRTSWSVKIPYFLPNHVVIFVLFFQKLHGSSKMGYYPFLVISLNGHNSSQEQDRDMPQETFFVQNYMLKTCSLFIFSFWQKKMLANPSWVLTKNVFVKTKK